MPLTIVLAKAREQRGALVPSLAQRLGIAWLCCPASSPHLHLSERLGKFGKKQGLYSTYDADPWAFQQAMSEGMEQASDTPQEARASLWTWKLQSFTAVPVIGEESNISWCPVARRTQRKVPSIAA